MKLFVLLTLCAFGAAAPNMKEAPIVINEVVSDASKAYYNPSYFTYRRPSGTPNGPSSPSPPSGPSLPATSDELLDLLRGFVNNVINNGYPQFGIPPLEPLWLENFEFIFPARLINLDLKLKGVFASGFGNFIVHKSDLNVNELTFAIDVEFPVLDIKADEYDMVGDIFTAIPLYGKGRAHFYVEGFRFQAKLFLKQSDNGMSVIIDRVENAAYSIPHLKSNLTGAIGGGDIDAIVNVMIEQVIMGYVNRFHGAIAIVTSSFSVVYGNPLLDQLDSWRYIAALLPVPYK